MGISFVYAEFPDTVWKIRRALRCQHVPALQDFLKNNRGIDDGSDLPEEYLSNLYDRIINDEIKMKVRPPSLF